MTDDFVTRLGVALREAADREERRARLARTGDRADHAAAAAAEPGRRHGHRRARAGGGRLRSGELRAATRRHRRDRRSSRSCRPAGGLDQIVSGFGSAWVADTDTQTLLRMDPATRRVTARFPLGGSMKVMPGKGAMWVGLTQNQAVPPAAHRPAHEPDRRAPARPRRARRVDRQRAGDGREQPLAGERRGGRADRPGERSRHRDGAHGPQRLPDAIARGGRRRSVGARQRRAPAAPRRRHRPAQGDLPGARRQPRRRLPDERALRGR